MTAIQDRTARSATVSPTGVSLPDPRPDRPRTARTALTLGAFVALGPLTIDMYLPALPTITTELETTSAAVQLTLTGTLVGLALGQLVLGPLSDTFGRRRPLIAGTALHVVASLLVLLAPNIAVLGALRVLQGVGTAAGAVIAIAVVRDLFDGRAAATMLSRLFLVIGAAPVLAPTIGGEVLRFTSWRGVFVVLAAYGLALLAVGWFLLRETLPPERRSTSGVAGTLRGYRALFRDRAYVGLVLVAGLTMAGLFAYVSGSSFVYQDEFGLDEQQFGLLFGAGAFWLIAATQLNPVLLRWFSPAQLLVAGTVAGAASGALLLVLAVTGTGALLAVALPLWAVLFACGLALPNAPALALSRHGNAAGTAAALLGAVQFGVGAAVSPLVGLLGNDAVAMGTVIVGSLTLAIVVLVTVVRPWELAEPDPEAAPVAVH
ncbi:multidrug effflux MFS transporter [Modestobacter versicolor]|uniref:Bcr/CflA family drug resistance efflux transporter n=1 Tax=Modestobacter versicolor TaxID=429133 RepID=A0A323V694_9ACTN|nr:multidrug effflux MFS transporter [Modestobacter versicolor]MBB3677564.1 DHA1 family bicyclomycin/chloramphenicol resistance-like MFS transporter [Modestobacter versicolor]PZA19590.1 Bcr/CflA family drug resistance efflux transporter [Modestobacter versicolor]